MTPAPTHWAPTGWAVLAALHPRPERNDMTTDHDQTPTFDEWCIVELLGHRRLAGRIREVQVAGHGFLRLDIPEAGADPARTQFVAPGSVYALHPVDEATARAAAASWRPAPVQRWELAALTAKPDDEAEWSDAHNSSTEEDPF